LPKRAANKCKKRDDKLESHIVKGTTSYHLSQQGIQMRATSDWTAKQAQTGLPA